MLVDHALQSSAPTRANRRNQPTSTARSASPMTSPTGCRCQCRRLPRACAPLRRLRCCAVGEQASGGQHCGLSAPDGSSPPGWTMRLGMTSDMADRVAQRGVLTRAFEDDFGPLPFLAVHLARRLLPPRPAGRPHRRRPVPRSARLAEHASPTGRASGRMIYTPVTRVKGAVPAARRRRARRGQSCWAAMFGLPILLGDEEYERVVHAAARPSLCRPRLRRRGSESPLRQPRRDRYGHRAR